MGAEILKIAAQLVKDGNDQEKNNNNYLEAVFNYTKALNLFLEFQENLDRRKKVSLYDFCEKNIVKLRKKILELATQVSSEAFELEDRGELVDAAKKHQDAIEIFKHFREITSNSALIRLCEDKIQKLTTRIKQINDALKQLKQEELEERKKAILEELNAEKQRILELQKEIEREKFKHDKERQAQLRQELATIRDDIDTGEKKPAKDQDEMKLDLKSLKKDLEDLL